MLIYPVPLCSYFVEFLGSHSFLGRSLQTALGSFLICCFVVRLELRTAAGNGAYFVDLFPKVPFC